MRLTDPILCLLISYAPLAASCSKRGLAANDDIPIENFTSDKSKISWKYNWDSTTKRREVAFEFVPMLWGIQQYHTTAWPENAQNWLTYGGSSHLLGFNEPDLSQQANLTVAEAVDGWRAYMEPFAGRARLGAPAISNAGYEWLRQFLSACTDCHIDFIPIHWYSSSVQDSAQLQNEFKNWVEKICRLADYRPVWVTEFQPQGSVDLQTDFLRWAMEFLDQNPCICRYAYFGTAHNSKVLLHGDGPTLSLLGTQYAFEASEKERSDIMQPSPIWPTRGNTRHEQGQVQLGWVDCSRDKEGFIRQALVEGYLCEINVAIRIDVAP